MPKCSENNNRDPKMTQDPTATQWPQIQKNDPKMTPTVVLLLGLGSQKMCAGARGAEPPVRLFCLWLWGVRGATPPVRFLQKRWGVRGRGHFGVKKFFWVISKNEKCGVIFGTWRKKSKNMFCEYSSLGSFGSFGSFLGRDYYISNVRPRLPYMNPHDFSSTINLFIQSFYDLCVFGSYWIKGGGCNFFVRDCR